MIWVVLKKYRLNFYKNLLSQEKKNRGLYATYTFWFLNAFIFISTSFLFTGGALQAHSRVQSHHTVQPKTKKVNFLKSKLLLFYELEYRNIMLFAYLCQIKIEATTTVQLHHAKIIYS